MDTVGLILSIGELNAVLHNVASLGEFLKSCAGIVSRHLGASVCSIYIYDSPAETLTLKATIGLNQDLVDTVALKLGEGLSGMVMQDLKPVNLTNCSLHPNYRFFPGLLEENYEAFLAVPIQRGKERIGVLVVQRKNEHPFSPEDEIALRAVGNQLAAMIEYTRLLMKSAASPQTQGDTHPAVSEASIPCPLFIKGKSGSKGFTFAPVIMDEKHRSIELMLAMALAKPGSLQDFEDALEKTIFQLTKYQARVEEQLADAASLVFAAHLLLLNDVAFTGKMREKIALGSHPADAVATIAKEYVVLFDAQQDPYLRQKSDDIRDIALRILACLAPQSAADSFSTKGRIVVARELLPSDILVLVSQGVSGILLVNGGVTSHTAILARSLKVPLVYADVPQLLSLPAETTAIIDADSGNIYLNPTPEILSPFRIRAQRAAALKSSIKGCVPGTTHTLDNIIITLSATVNLISDVADSVAVGADGIGLYRTEFPFIIRSSFPSEEEQYVVYRKVVDGMPSCPVTFRTLDIGGDKILAYFNTYSERNPFLGMRSLRFCLSHPDVFKQQIRAILRAGAGKHIKVMFPMVSSVDELLAALDMLSECQHELEKSNLDFNRSPQIGTMIEIPSVLDILDELAGYVDFFSLGTNDFIQYMLAVDRTNEKVAQYYCAHHPAVLRAIKRVAEAAIRNNCSLSICGDMAHQIEYLPFFLGCGVREFCIDPQYFPAVRAAFSSMSSSEAQKETQALLHCATIAQTSKIIQTHISVAPE